MKSARDVPDQEQAETSNSKIPQSLLVPIQQRLERVYGSDTATGIMAEMKALLLRHAGQIRPTRIGWSERDALLITYADSIIGDQPPLRTLHHFLQKEVGDRVSYVHLLPFYPFTSDDGFAITDFRSIRGDLGNWDDVQHFAKDYRLAFDAVINHVSSTGNYMSGYCAGDPRYADFFIALDPNTDTSSVLRTRNLPLLHDYETTDGKKWLWTTFSRDQVDLNFANPAVLLEILDVLLDYAVNGASMIRLDAIPYLWKQIGTSCAHLPQTHELIKLIRDVFDAVAPSVLLLTETNVPHHENVSYFGDHGDEAQVIYNFSLAPLILWSLVKGDSSVLTTWAQGIEWISHRATYLNITATHDGIGMRPTEGILSESERSELVQMSYDHGGDVTGKRNADGSISPYELNLNYFDAVNDPRSDESEDLQVQRFLVSQAIPMALMGMPGIYIHSLLGSRNDIAGVKATGQPRKINREQLRLEILQTELADPQSIRFHVLFEMKRLLGIRSHQTAFHPDALQEIPDLGPELFAVFRHNKQTGQRIMALHNITNHTLELPIIRTGIVPGSVDALNGEILDQPTLALAPYQVRWIAYK